MTEIFLGHFEQGNTPKILIAKIWLNRAMVEAPHNI
jgi:hypothetical protein